MNREIKFRAFAKNSKQIIQDYNGNLNDKDFELMQFTGMVDKNQKEVFDGDIIKIHDWNGATGESIAEVYWCDSYLCWSAQWLPKQSGAHSMAYIKRTLKKTGELPTVEIGNLRLPQIEIIGNKFENPELLTTPTKEKK